MKIDIRILKSEERQTTYGGNKAELLWRGGGESGHRGKVL
jgi:hypothetical protein